MVDVRIVCCALALTACSDRPAAAPQGIGREASPGLSELLADAPCGATISATLEEWGAHADPRRAAPSPTHQRFRFATDRIGHWVQLDLAPGRTPTLLYVDPSGGVRRTLSPGCAVRSEDLDAEPPPGPSTFTDADLEALLASDRTAVVYVWSPHMPLSVDGFAEISGAANALGLVVAPVLFPGGDRTFARSEAERAGIPTEGLREVASVELVFRDATVHAPAIVVFADGRVSSTLPGYRNAEGYARFLRAFLDEP